jgi:hypothetical protein
VTLIGAVLAWTLVRRRPEPVQVQPESEPAQAADGNRELTLA